MERGGSSGDWKKWRTLRNQINKELKQAKKRFLQKRLEHKIGNSSSPWEGVKSYLGWKCGGSPDLIITSKGEATQEPPKVADEIQKAFKGKLSEVEESLGRPSGNYLKIVRNMTRGRCRVFKFSEVSKEDVISQIKKAPNKSSMGRDEISYNILKMLDVFVADPLKAIINLSLKQN